MRFKIVINAPGIWKKNAFKNFEADSSSHVANADVSKLLRGIPLYASGRHKLQCRFTARGCKNGGLMIKVHIVSAVGRLSKRHLYPLSGAVAGDPVRYRAIHLLSWICIYVAVSTLPLSTVIILNNRHYDRLCRKDFLTRGREVMAQKTTTIKLYGKLGFQEWTLPKRPSPRRKKVSHLTVNVA